MASNESFMNMRLVLIILTICGLVATSKPSMACSIAPPAEPVMKSDGRIELPFRDNDYAILAEVIGQKVIEHFGKSKLPVTAIRVRVIKSDTSRVNVRQELSFHLFTIADTSCGMQGVSLTNDQYPLGSILRIIAKSNAIPKWEADARIKKVSSSNQASKEVSYEAG